MYKGFTRSTRVGALQTPSLTLFTFKNLLGFDSLVWKSQPHLSPHYPTTNIYLYSSSAFARPLTTTGHISASSNTTQGSKQPYQPRCRDSQSAFSKRRWPSETMTRQSPSSNRTPLFSASRYQKIPNQFPHRNRLCSSTTSATTASAKHHFQQCSSERWPAPRRWLNSHSMTRRCWLMGGCRLSISRGGSGRSASSGGRIMVRLRGWFGGR